MIFDNLNGHARLVAYSDKYLLHYDAHHIELIYTEKEAKLGKHEHPHEQMQVFGWKNSCYNHFMVMGIIVWFS